MTLNAIWTREYGRGPMRSTRSGQRRSRALDWLLLTNYPMNTLAEAERIIFGYSQRWRIEDFHKAWKSGVCNVEQTQLRTRAHVIKWATVLAAVAIRKEAQANRNQDDSAILRFRADVIWSSAVDEVFSSLLRITRCG
jgi:hypothetical protein